MKLYWSYGRTHFRIRCSTIAVAHRHAGTLYWTHWELIFHKFRRKFSLCFVLLTAFYFGFICFVLLKMTRGWNMLKAYHFVLCQCRKAVFAKTSVVAMNWLREGLELGLQLAWLTTILCVIIRGTRLHYTGELHFSIPTWESVRTECLILFVDMEVPLFVYLF